MDTNVQSNTKPAAIAANGKHEPTREELLARIQQLEDRAKGKFAIEARLLGGTHKGPDGADEPNKGNLVCRGFGRFPKSFYAQELEMLFEHREEILACIEKNRQGLSWK